MYTSNEDILTRQTKYYEFDIKKKKFYKKNGYYIKKSFFFHYEFDINQIFIYLFIYLLILQMAMLMTFCMHPIGKVAYSINVIFRP